MKKLISVLSLLLACLLTGCGRKADGKETPGGQTSGPEVTACEPVDTAGDGYYSAVFAGNAIVVKSAGDEESKLEISISYDAYQVYISMFDEDHGSILYCSSPAAGQMTKILYYTEDGWGSYTENDISSQLDGYPNSLTMNSAKSGYIGAQLRSDAYLYCTDDAGQTWTPYAVDASVDNCNGYAPVFDGENACLILDMKSSTGHTFRLYCSEDGGEKWEAAGEFSLDEDVSRYFMKDGAVYLVDVKGSYWRLKKS